MQTRPWHAVILAASRGPNDPMAKAYGVVHKCALPIAGQPMLRRVTDALRDAGIALPIVLCIENEAAAALSLAKGIQDTRIIPPRHSAAASARATIEALNHYPTLITTGDHALLTPEMVIEVIRKSESSGADVLVALATREVVTAAYPETRRTYFNLGGTRVSGCNLFAIMNESGMKMIEAWSLVEQNRKKPWRLVAQYGLAPLFYFLTGTLTPDRAFGLISKKLGIRVAPVFMTSAEAAIDVDKPADFELAEKILKTRKTA